MPTHTGHLVGFLKSVPRCRLGWVRGHTRRLGGITRFYTPDPALGRYMQNPAHYHHHLLLQTSAGFVMPCPSTFQKGGGLIVLIILKSNGMRWRIRALGNLCKLQLLGITGQISLLQSTRNNWAGRKRLRAIKSKAWHTVHTSWTLSLSLFTGVHFVLLQMCSNAWHPCTSY